MSAEIPSTIRALVVQRNRTVAVQELPVPTLESNEILVKVEAIAQNPTDWKHAEFIPTAIGKIIGCDFSGIVVKLGKDTKSGVAIGDHVAGFVHGGTYKDRGAFATYLKTESDLVWTVPEGLVSHEEAATLGCGFWTAIQAFYHPTRLSLVEPPSRVSGESWVFVYGGSTSVGMYAIQLAHLSGYKVATVASPHNYELVKSLGADVVFDYKSPTVVQDIKKATNNGIHAGLDTIAEGNSQTLSVSVFGPGKGKLIVLFGPDAKARRLRPDVEIKPTLLYTAMGRPFKIMSTPYPAAPQDREQIARFLPKIPEIIKSGAVKPNKIKVWEGGLESCKDGFKYMKEGKVSGVKIVYKP